MNFMLEAFQQSVLFFPLVLGVYLSYAILKTTDMTTEGSFVLGGAVFAKLLSLECNLFLSALAAVTMGNLAGVGVSAIQAKDRIHSLTAGIIGLFMLYTINFQIMGRPNIGLTLAAPMSHTLLAIIIFSVACLVWGMNASRFGLMLRAMGANATLLKSLGKNIEFYRFFGLSVSNALAALCGVLTTLTNGYADLTMGFGMTLTAIGTVMMGRQLQNLLFPHRPFNAGIEILACFVGVYFYFMAINGFLLIGADPIYLKFLLGLLLIVLLRRKPS